MMQEYHCGEPHPDFPGKWCGAFFFKGDFTGEIEIRCWRCHRSVIADSRTVYTTAQVDKVFVVS